MKRGSATVVFVLIVLMTAVAIAGIRYLGSSGITGAAVFLEALCNGLDDDGDHVPDGGCDSDGDGFIDWTTVCAGQPLCVDDNGNVANAPCAGCAIPDCDDTNPNVNPLAPEICNDGKDNNCNGPADCADPACAADANCVAGAVEICFNGINDDANGLIDCADPACAAATQAVAHGTISCSNNQYSVACDMPGVAYWGNCDGNALNGCEINKYTDVNNCGTCGTRCTADAGKHVSQVACTTGACTIGACADGWSNANGLYGDGCEKQLVGVCNDYDTRSCTAPEISGRVSCKDGMQVCSDDVWYPKDSCAGTLYGDSLGGCTSTEPGTCSGTATKCGNVNYDADYGNDWNCMITLGCTWDENTLTGTQTCSANCANYNGNKSACMSTGCTWAPACTDCICTANEVQSCYTGTAGTKDVGPCKAGNKTCAADGKSWSACTGEVKPATEICDGKDNNCDDITDNITETQNCGTGICAGGTQARTCANGNFSTWGACSTDGLKTTETCNGLDDDCNGVIDNGLTPQKTFYKDGDGDGYGGSSSIRACAAPPNYVNNSLDCNDFSSAVKPGATEICIDLVDNNCNNLTDDSLEGCGKQANTSMQKQIIATPIAGNGICEAGETQLTTPSDCGCPYGQKYASGKCEDIAQADEEIANQECENDVVEGTEQCDTGEGNDAKCPGACSTDCICPFEVGDSKCDKADGEDAENSPEDCSFKFAGVAWLLAAMLALVGTGVGYWYFKIRPRATLSSVAELEGLGSAEAAATAGKAEGAEAGVESYINQTLSMGFSPAQIKSALIEKGWDVDVVDEKLKSAGADQSKLQDIADTKGVGTQTEDTSKVNGYVSHCLKDGYSPVQIKTALLSSGWPEKDVDELLANNKAVQSDINKIAKKTNVKKTTRRRRKNTKKFAEESLKAGHTLNQIAETLEKEGVDLSEINKNISNP